MLLSEQNKSEIVFQIECSKCLPLNILAIAIYNNRWLSFIICKSM